MTRLFLIDATALAYRSHFAFAQSRTGGLLTRAGRPTSAAYGFTMTLRALLEREHPDKIAAAFDGPRESLERMTIYPEYKSTRSKMPDELVGQLEAIERIVRGYGIANVTSPGQEADDVIGTLAVAGRDAGMEVFIVSGDKDFSQLVCDRVKLWNLTKPTTAPEILGPAEVQAKFGVAPERMIDLLALMGDSSDNVPGVPKVGQKTATVLLQQFGSLDELLARTAEVKQPAIRAALEQHRQDALLSRDLVRIRTDVPLSVSLDELGPVRIDPAALDAVFCELEFETLRASLPRAPETAVQACYCLVRTGEQLAALLDGVRSARAFAFRAEATGRAPRRSELAGVAFSKAPGEAWYVPLNLQAQSLPGGRAGVLRALRELFEDPGLAKTAHDAKFAMAALRSAGIALRGLEFDTMLASYCIAPGSDHRIEALAMRYFDVKKTPAKELVGSGRQQKTFDQVDVLAASDYACEDAALTWRLRARLEPELQATGVERIFRELELPLVPVLLAMESDGIAVDLGHLARLSHDWQTRLTTLERRIEERAGTTINLGSAQQVGELLFEKLEVHRAAGMTRVKKTRTGQWQTGHDVLEELARHHEVPRLLLEWRQLSKLKGTYADSLPEMVDPATGRIHTTFNQAVAATGRLSSDEPNLQNIPIRTAEGREVRRAFVPRAKDWVLLSADYSQIELRILAHMAQEPALIEAFRRREDIHARTAALVRGILPALVTPEMRNQAKVINYGLVYGMGASRLAHETGMTPPEAKKFIDAYFRALPKVKEWLDATLEEARRTRVVWTLYGRRRHVPELDSVNAMQRIAAENIAVNTPIQGSAADIVKRAMIALHAELERSALRARLLLQVHDELVLDVPEAEVEPVTEIVRRTMAGAADLAVPLEVSVGVGKSWLEAH
jgi:DNA polymerase-1